MADWAGRSALSLYGGDFSAPNDDGRVLGYNLYGPQDIVGRVRSGIDDRRFAASPMYGSPRLDMFFGDHFPSAVLGSSRPDLMQALSGQSMAAALWDFNQHPRLMTEPDPVLRNAFDEAIRPRGWR